MIPQNISIIKTVNAEEAKDFEPKVNNLLDEGWVILEMGTMKRSKNEFDHFYAQMGKLREIKEVKVTI